MAGCLGPFLDVMSGGGGGGGLFLSMFWQGAGGRSMPFVRFWCVAAPLLQGRNCCAAMGRMNLSDDKAFYWPRRSKLERITFTGKLQPAKTILRWYHTRRGRLSPHPSPPPPSLACPVLRLC